MFRTIRQFPIILSVVVSAATAHAHCTNEEVARLSVQKTEVMREAFTQWAKNKEVTDVPQIRRELQPLVNFISRDLNSYPNEKDAIYHLPFRIEALAKVCDGLGPDNSSEWDNILTKIKIYEVFATLAKHGEATYLQKNKLTDLLTYVVFRVRALKDMKPDYRQRQAERAFAIFIGNLYLGSFEDDRTVLESTFGLSPKLSAEIITVGQKLRLCQVTE